MSSKILNRVCPICKSATGLILHNQSFVSVKGSTLPKNYDVVNCIKCGFVFADTSATQNDYNTYYSILSKYEDTNISSGSGFDQNDYNRLVRTADIIEKHIAKNKSILDLGCANGGQLKILKERGFTKLTGVDPSGTCVKNVKSLGIDAFHSQMFEDSFIEWDKRFDLIILSHVLEHIRDLDYAIQIVKNKLTDSGILYLEVPDASMYNKYFIVPYYFIDCEHINHFSITSLNNLLLQFGFSVIENDQNTIKLTETNDYPIFYSLYKNGTKCESNLKFDKTVINSFNEFIIQSKTQNNSDNIIQTLIQSQEEVIIWGAGQYALRLLASSNLSKTNIIGFIDSDRSKQNKIIDNYKIFSPDYIKDRNVTILICSALYAKDIIKKILSINSKLNYYVLN